MSSTLNRIVQMDALIRAGGYPGVADFKARFVVSARTIYSDIDYFKSTLRAPIIYSRSQGGYAYTDPTWPLPTIITTEGEMLDSFSAPIWHGATLAHPLRRRCAVRSPNFRGTCRRSSRSISIYSCSTSPSNRAQPPVPIHSIVAGCIE
jgi:hypothetical protein